MDISGYAYLLSEYHDIPCLKAAVVKVWDEYLDQDSAQPRLEFFAAAVLLTESAFEMAHRSVNRTRWKQMIQQLLRDLDRQEVPPGPGIRHTYSPPETIAIHKSPLVRIFATNDDLSFYDGIDIFLAKYVRQRDDGKNLDFGRLRNRDLAKEISIEKNRDMTDGSL
jgi:hypothetical protein